MIKNEIEKGVRLASPPMVWALEHYSTHRCSDFQTASALRVVLRFKITIENTY